MDHQWCVTKAKSSHSYPFNSKTSTSQVWRTLSLFWACFIFRKVEPAEYRIFCSHFGALPLCQTVVKSCSYQFLVRWFMVKELIRAKVVWQKTMMLFWFDCLFFNWFYAVNRPQEFRSWCWEWAINPTPSKVIYCISLKDPFRTKADYIWIYRVSMQT